MKLWEEITNKSDTMEKVKVKIINKSGYDCPVYKTPMSAGCDLCAVIDQEVVLHPMMGKSFKTGIYAQIPDGYEAQVRGRSGMNFKSNIICPVGTVDADYRGEIAVMLYNLSKKPYVVMPGDSIAQLVIAPVVQAEWEEVESLDETERGEGGFGSTGRR